MRILRSAAGVLCALAAACSPPAGDRDVTSPAGGPGEPAAVQSSASVIALCERRTAADPRDHLSPALLAELRLRRAAETQEPQEYAAAESAARTSLERSPRHAPAAAALARALAATGRTADAVRVLDEHLDREPRSVPLLCAAFDVAEAGGDRRAASAYAERLLALNEEPQTLCRLAQVAVREGDAERAVGLLRRAADEADELGGLPTEIAEYRRRAGTILLGAGRTDDALAELDAAIAANPRDADAWAARAVAMQRKGDAACAASDAATARAIRPVAGFAASLEAALSAETKR